MFAHDNFSWEPEGRPSWESLFSSFQSWFNFHSFMRPTSKNLNKKKILINKWLSQTVHLAEKWRHWQPWLSLPCLPQASCELDLGPSPHFSPPGLSAPVPVMSQQSQFPADHSSAMHSSVQDWPTRRSMSSTALDHPCPKELSVVHGLGWCGCPPRSALLSAWDSGTVLVARPSPTAPGKAPPASSPRETPAYAVPWHNRTLTSA